MVTKKMRTGAAAKKSRVKMGNLKLNRETVKDLSGKERKQIKGGAIPPPTSNARISCGSCAKQ